MLPIEVGQNEEGLSGYEDGAAGQMGRVPQADNLAPAEIDGERFDGSQLGIIHRPLPFTSQLSFAGRALKVMVSGCGLLVNRQRGATDQEYVDFHPLKSTG
jgi:hypothetical protein